MVLRSGSWGLVWVVGALGLHCESSPQASGGDAGASGDAATDPVHDVSSSSGLEVASSRPTSTVDGATTETASTGSSDTGASDSRLTTGTIDRSTDDGRSTPTTSDTTAATETSLTDPNTGASEAHSEVNNGTTDHNSTEPTPTTSDTTAATETSLTDPNTGASEAHSEVNNGTTDHNSTEPATSSSETLPFETAGTTDVATSSDSGEPSTHVLECAWGSWFDATASACVPVTSCPPGQFVVEGPTGTSDRVCGACPEGTYTRWSNLNSCTPFRTCQAGERFVQAGDAAHDVVCEYCLAGTYSPGGETPECVSCPSGTTSFNGDGCCFPVTDSPSGVESADAGASVAPSSAVDSGVIDGVCSEPFSVRPLPACGDLLVDAAGYLYLATQGESSSVTKLRPNGETLWQWTDGRSTTLRYGLDGQLYLLDMENTRLSVALLGPDGQEQPLWTAEALPEFHEVNIGADGAFYVMGSIDVESGGTVGHVTRLDATGNWEWTIELTPPVEGFVWGWFSTQPTHMALDAAGGVYVLSSLQTPFGDSLQLEVTKLSATGQVSWLEQIDVPEFSSGPSGLVTTNDAVVLGYDFTQSFFVGSKLQHIASVDNLSFGGERLPANRSFYANVEVASDGYEEFRANSWISQLSAGRDGTWAAIGTTDGYFDAPSAGGVDWFLSVFSPNGDVELEQFGTAGNDSVCGTAVDGDGNVFVVGQAPLGVSFAGLPAGSAYLLRYPAER